MLFIITCTVLVSLSELFQSNDQAQMVVESRAPIYAAVLVSLLMPLVCTIFTNFIKYADKVLRLNAIDWNCAFYLCMTLAFQIIGIYNFTTHAIEFEFELWLRGFFGSLVNLLGSIFIVSAFNTNGAPFGPIGALVNMQTIIVVSVEAIRTRTMPYSMQIVGLLLGIIGALVLTIPD